MLTLTVTTTAKPGPGEKALDELLSLDGRAVFAGLFEPEQASKGAAHEYGTSKLPARPWASVAADSGESQLATQASRALGEVADGRTSGEDALDKLGAFEAEQLRGVITGGRVGGPALAPSTVARKGSTVKLIDEGDMLGAITHQIDDGTVNADG